MGLQLIGTSSTVATTVQQPVQLSAAPPPSSPPPTTSLAPGFRFHPTDEELVTYYLRRKVCGKSLRLHAVSQIDVYKCEPWQLAEFSSLKTRDREWYFFTAIDKKYENGSRLNRATGTGYWKATGKDRHVRHQNQVIGMKKTLVFHSGRSPDGKRTNWVMHEYRLAACEDSKNYEVAQEKHAFVLCKIFLKSGLGAPNASRYAPFIQEEWDDEDATLGVVPGGEVEDEMITGDDMPVRGKIFEQGTNPMAKAPVTNNESHNFASICKRGKSVAELEPLSPSQHKKSKCDDDPRISSSSNANGFEDSTIIKDEFHHTTEKMYPTLMGVPLLGPKKSESANLPTLDYFNLEKFVPPGYLKFISNLEDEIVNVSRERDTLKLEVLRAQALISTLQSRIDFLGKDNEDLKKIV